MKPRRVSYRKAQTERVVRMKSFGTRDRDNEWTNHCNNTYSYHTDNKIYRFRNLSWAEWAEKGLEGFAVVTSPSSNNIKALKLSTKGERGSVG